MDSSLSVRTKRILTLGGLFLCLVTVAGLGAAMVTGLPGGGEGTISGTVYDSAGDPVESQNVILSGYETNSPRQTRTSENGFLRILNDPGTYEFTGLVDGNYTVQVVDSDDEYERQQAQPGDVVDFEPVGSETEGNGNHGSDGTTENTSEESVESNVSGTVNIVPDGALLPASTTVTLSDGEFTRTATGYDDGSDDGANLDRFIGAADFTAFRTVNTLFR